MDSDTEKHDGYNTYRLDVFLILFIQPFFSFVSYFKLDEMNKIPNSGYNNIFGSLQVEVLVRKHN